MADRNETLVNFQAITGIDDIAVCLDILEQKGWDLVAAVSSVIPQDFSAVAADSGRPQGGAFIDLTGSGSGLVDLTSSSTPGRLESNLVVSSVRTIECSLGVYYHGRLVSIQLPTDASVLQVKKYLEAETGVPVAGQLLTGWPVEEVTDETRLGDMGLHEKVPYHLRMEQRPHFGRPSSLELEVDSHPLLPPPLPPPPPPEAKELLQETEEVVTVRSTPTSSSSSIDALESQSEEELADTPMDALDDAIFVQDDEDNPAVKAMREPLIPRECTDPSEALQHFTEKFEQRYGEMHPLFFVGSLAGAVEEATTGSVVRGARKPMFIYLHHDASVLSNIFCSQLLCSESIVNYLTNNFVSWAWDLTHHEQRIQLLAMVQECFGNVAKASVDEIKAESLPAILIVYKAKGSIDIRNVIQGETNLDALMTTLLTAMEDHQMHMDWEAREERERLARESMIAEQNRAYRESLEADREKKRLRELEEQQREEQERDEQRQREEREMKLHRMAASVPQEPAPGGKEQVLTFRIRCPDGTTIQRRFLARHRLEDLMNFLGSKEYLTEDYKIITRVPRRDLGEVDEELTLGEAGLCPQEMLFIEER